MISTNSSKSSMRRKALPENAVLQCTQCRNLVRPKGLADPAHTCPKCGASEWVVYKPESTGA